MAINEWKIWQKLGFVKPAEEIADINKDLKAIDYFLKQAGPNVRNLSTLIAKMRKLSAKETKLRKAGAHVKVVRDLVLKQVQLYDRILKYYEILELDTDVNGERIKKISTALGKKAKKEYIDKKWIDIIRKSDRWTFDW